MGWSFSIFPQTKQDLVKRLVHSSDPDRTCLAHSLKGSVLWSVWRVPETTFIRCDLIKVNRDGTSGYKDMCEQMHPYYYTCPVSYLDMAPVACQEWRDKVVEAHKKRTAKYEAGQIVGISGYTIPALKVINPKQGVDRNGRLFKLPPKTRITGVLPEWPVQP